jgi:hypothetical protein
MSIVDLDDESLLLYYNHLRREVEAERVLPFKLVTNDVVRKRASALREEIIRRQLQCPPLDWP